MAYLFLALFALAPLSSFWAQDDDYDYVDDFTLEEKPKEPPNTGYHSLLLSPETLEAKWLIKASLMSLLDVVSPSLQAAVEYRFAKHFSVQLQGGWVFNYPSFTGRERKLRGLRLRPELRYYFKDAWSNKRSKGNQSLSLEVLFRDITEYRRDWMLRHNRSYEQLIDYRRVKRNWGLHVKFNDLHHFRASPWFIEYGIGLGVRSVFIQNKDIPFDAETRGIDWLQRPVNILFILPSAVLTLKVGRVF